MPYHFYSPKSSESDGEEDAFLPDLKASQEQRNARTWRSFLVILPWILSILFGSLSLAFIIGRANDNTTTKFGSYENGFDTDIVTSSRIPMEQIRFKGSPRFSSNGTGSIKSVDETAPWPENMVLFGEPSREIDANWERLIGYRYFSISEEEATRAWGEKRHEYIDQRRGGYTAGLDLFHTLHCVNALRKALHPDYYNAHHSHGPFHLEHCLDAIRQSIQCYGSTTLIPTQYREGLRRNYIDSDQVRVCRSFTFLREFTDSRRPGHDDFKERDMSLVDAEQHKAAVAWKHAHDHGHHGKHEVN